MTDPTEGIRRELVNVINAVPIERKMLEADVGGRVWDTNELCADYDVLGFMAPFVVVRRRADGKRGSMMFQHHPRFYWGFVEG